MKHTILLIALFAVFYSISATSFQSWKSTHNKIYSSEEEHQHRQQIYLNNLKMIEEHNRLHDEGLTSYRLKMNAFGDMTGKEFHQFVKTSNQRKNQNIFKVDQSTEKLLKFGVQAPDSFDWRNNGVVPHVSSQGVCGDAPVFAESDAVIAALSINAGKFTPFDLTQIENCLKDGCSGIPEGEVFNYIALCGVPTLNVPNDKTCKYGQTKSVPAINGYACTKRGDEQVLVDSIYANGPHAATLDASRPSFQFYSSGVYYDKSCSMNTPDHEMLLVGYGGTGSSKFFIAQNSWGVTWGMNGSIEISRGSGNNCGIANEACYPIIGSSTFKPNATCYGN